MSDEHEVRVHADALRYTRDGLVRPDAIRLRPGARNRVVIERPARLRSVAASHGGFPDGSAFPMPALVSAFLFPHEGNLAPLFGGDGPRAATYQIYAHTDTAGGDADNKALSEQRATLAAALLTASVDDVAAIADEEGWGLEHAQVLLRMLRHDPGPIDGIAEVLTADAVASFQRAYAKGRFHERQRDLSPRNPELEVTAKLDPPTFAALVEAFVVDTSPGVLPSQLHPTHPANGCAGFNPVSSTAASPNRRISLVAHASLPPHHDAAPCRQGDEQACAVFGEGEQRCIWHRLHVEDARPEDVVHHHFRPSWLLLTNAYYMLSALTTVADEDLVEFQVFTARERIEGERDPDPTLLVEELGRPIVNTPRYGVAQVVWVPPADFTPDKEGYIERAGERVVPVFRISHEPTSTTAYSSWPIDEVVVLFSRSFIDREYAAHPDTKLVLECESQAYARELPAGDALPFDDDHYTLSFKGMEPNGRFTMHIDYGDGVRVPLFADVNYDDLHNFAETGQRTLGSDAATPVLEAPDPEHGDDVPPLLDILATAESHIFF